MSLLRNFKEGGATKLGHLSENRDFWTIQSLLEQIPPSHFFKDQPLHSPAEIASKTPFIVVLPGIWGFKYVENRHKSPCLSIIGRLGYAMILSFFPKWESRNVTRLKPVKVQKFWADRPPMHSTGLYVFSEQDNIP